MAHPKHVWVPMVLGLIACSTAHAPCAGSTCPSGLECLANRCVVAGSYPVAPKTIRRVLEPTTLTVLSELHRESDGVPATVTFGSATWGPTAVYLRFDPSWKQEGEVDAAFLVFEPTRGGQSSGADIRVGVWSVEERWAAQGLTWHGRPRAGPPHHEGLSHVPALLPLRVDVTAAVRRMRERTTDHGLVVTSDPEDSAGATFHTGAGGGTGPRLDLYLKAR